MTLCPYGAVGRVRMGRAMTARPAAGPLPMHAEVTGGIAVACTDVTRTFMRKQEDARSTKVTQHRRAAPNARATIGYPLEQPLRRSGLGCAAALGPRADGAPCQNGQADRAIACRVERRPPFIIHKAHACAQSMERRPSSSWP